MKKLLISAVLIAGISPAIAGEVTITVPDTFRVTMQQTSITLERCMGAIVSHGDTSTCGAVQNILTQLANLPETPVQTPAPPPTPNPTPAPQAAASPTPAPAASPTPAPEAQKKTEGEPAAK